jgi:hypothetical protein
VTRLSNALRRRSWSGLPLLGFPTSHTFALLSHTFALLLLVLFFFAQALQRLAAPFLEWAATRYQARLATNLKKYGLRYDDLYDPMMDLVRTLV